MNLTTDDDDEGEVDENGVALWVNDDGDVTVKSTLNNNYAYLDSCSSYNQFITDEFLDNVRNTGTVLKGRCNAGVSTTNQQGKYGELDVWLNRKGIANILSIPRLEELKKKFYEKPTTMVPEARRAENTTTATLNRAASS